MMNHDVRFQQRWEFRRREVDGDTSSDDNGSNSRGDPNRNHKLVTDLILLENDEANDDQKCQRHDEKLAAYNGVQLETVKADEKKVNSCKKKKAVQKKPERRTVKKNTRKGQVNKNEMVMFKDLKIFADSLIHELAVAQGNMFAHMREEMRKLVNLEPITKNVRCSQKKIICLNNRTKTGVKPQKNDLTTTNEPQKGDGLRLSAMAHTSLAYGSDRQVAFSPHDPLREPQFQNLRNSIHLNDHIPSGVPMISSSGSKTEFDSLMMAAKTFSYRIAEFQPVKSVGLIGQNSSQATIQGIGFPIPLIQGSNNDMSSLTYCENSFMDNNGVGSRMNENIARFLGRSIVSSERMIPNSVISQIPHTNLRNEH